MTRYELEKIFSSRGNKIALLVLALALVLVIYALLSNTVYLDENDNDVTGFAAVHKLRELKSEWEGDLTEACIARAIEAISSPNRTNDDIQAVRDIRNLLNYCYGSFDDYDYTVADYLKPEDAVNFYPNRPSQLQVWLDSASGARFSDAEKSYLITKYQELETPLRYEYQDGWRALLSYSGTVIMLTTLVLAFVCAGIFSGEFTQRAAAVFFASRYGRSKAVAAKLKAGLIVVSCAYWLAVLLFTALVLGVFGADGADCQVQSNYIYWKSFLNFTNIELYIFIALGGYLGCVFMLLLVMLVSAKADSSVAAALIPFILIFLPSFLMNLNSSALNKLLALFPDQLIGINMAVKDFNVFTVFGKSCAAVQLLPAIYLPLTLALIPVIYAVYKRKEVQS